ncbi:MAG TPA: methylamine utilization protein [Casimicrobiaceae bacterium]|jgi:plastocyanin|nr:methylamine utilization protein [Casimicrobiaceae bacterium]
MRMLTFCAVGLLATGAAHAQTAEIAVSVTDELGKPVADAVVVAVPADGNLRPPAKSTDHPRGVIVDQVDKEFVPRVTAILVGTAVTFPNHDNVRHQVYSFSPAKRFELPLYAGVPAAPVVFDKPGVVVLGCNIHDWMIGYVYVSESPYFAKTGSDGKALLANLPPRLYALRVWHPQLELAEETTRKNVDASQARRVDAAWELNLKREVKVRRAPTAEKRGRY